ncbi:MAG: C25 family cysteine peptidase, partial [bacterium]
MKQSFFCFLFLPLLCFSLEREVVFSKDEVSFSKYNGYDVVSLPDCSYTSDIGKPSLPRRLIHLSLPPNATVEGIRIISITKEGLEGTYNILPSQPPAPLIEIKKEISFVEPDLSIYNSSNPYPESIVSYTKEGNLSGYNIIAIFVYPLQYIPKEKRLILNKAIRFEVLYKKKKVPLSIIRRNRETEERVLDIIKGLVKNPEDIPKFEKRGIMQVQSIPYLIITSEALKDGFKRLANWKEKKGILSQIVSVEEIIKTKEGIDTQEKIRNFIRDYYQNKGTIWVLLGGDTNVIPHRITHIFDVEFYDKWYSEIPCDLYYSDLDGDWDNDHDKVYGEIEDDVDMYPDVFVGRAPVDTKEEVSCFVNKVIDYEKAKEKGYQLKAFFMGFDADWWTYSEEGKEDIAKTYIPENFILTKEYDSEKGLHKADVLRALNDGQNIINHSDHANYNLIGVGCVNHGEVLYSSDLDESLTNQDKITGFLFSVGCLPAAIDKDCFAEHWLLNPKGGGFMVGNTRFGWYRPGEPGNGPSDLYDSQFFASLFSKGIYHIGQTLADTKAYYVGSAKTDYVMRWCMYTLVLIGDPEMALWTDIPSELVVSYLQSIPIGKHSLTIKVERGGNPVENALVCLRKENDFYASGYTDKSGRTTLDFELKTTGEIEITGSSQNGLYEGIIYGVPTSGSFVSYYSHSIYDMDKDGVVTPGDEVELGIVLKNYGFSLAPSVLATLTTEDKFVEILSCSKSYGSILPSGTASSEYYKFKVDNNSFLHNIRFLISIDDGAGGSSTGNLFIPIATSISGRVIDIKKNRNYSVITERNGEWMNWREGEGEKGRILRRGEISPFHRKRGEW